MKEVVNMLFYLSLYVQENDYACDVIDHILLILPLLEGCSYQALGSTFRILLQVKGIDNISNGLIGNELPNPIARQYDELILHSQPQLADLRYGIHTTPASNLVPK